MVQHSRHLILQTLLLLTFFLWGYIKDRVYATTVADCNELKVRIQAAVVTVTEDLLQNTFLEVEYLLAILQATKRAHIEVY